MVQCGYRCELHCEHCALLRCDCGVCEHVYNCRYCKAGVCSGVTKCLAPGFAT